MESPARKIFMYFNFFPVYNRRTRKLSSQFTTKHLAGTVFRNAAIKTRKVSMGSTDLLWLAHRNLIASLCSA
jgi:hypothetical protein